MSLFATLLNDPAAFDQWMACREIGARGSGTASDPWNGGVEHQSGISLTLTNNLSEATATTSTAYGYQDGDVVEITGVTGDDRTLWNGMFAIYGVNEHLIQIPDAKRTCSEPTRSSNGVTTDFLA